MANSPQSDSAPTTVPPISRDNVESLLIEAAMNGMTRAGQQFVRNMLAEIEALRLIIGLRPER